MRKDHLNARKWNCGGGNGIWKRWLPNGRKMRRIKSGWRKRLCLVLGVVLGSSGGMLIDSCHEGEANQSATGVIT